MKVLDASFLVDYLNGVDAAAEFLLANEAETFAVPVPAYAEVLAGEGNLPNGEIVDVVDDLSWAEIVDVDDETAVVAGEIAAEIGSEGPYLTGMDALIAAIGRQLDAPVVTSDGDLTHPATAAVVDVETYRD